MKHLLTARALVVRFLLVTAVLLSAATPLSLANARSTDIDSASDVYDQAGGLLGPLADNSGSTQTLPLLFTGDDGLLWNTFLGSNEDDFGYSIVSAGQGNFYVSGFSRASWGNPKRAYSGNLDVFVAKVDSSGTLLWNTFLGGEGDDNNGFQLAADGNGNVYVAGNSQSAWNFNSTPPIRPYSGDFDGFVAKLSPGGDPLWLAFLGGDQVVQAGNQAADSALAIALGGNGNVYVGGGKPGRLG